MKYRNRTYRDLFAWQKAMALVVQVYAETGQLPESERLGLVSQMRRSAVSAPSNIAEGWGRGRTRDFTRLLQVARASLFELSTQTEICQRLGVLGNWDSVFTQIDEVSRILQGLIRSRRASEPNH